MGIILPALFKSKLDPHQKEQGIVFSSLATFGPWFSTSGTVFFRDYTDHGTKHLTDVLATAAALIPSEAHAVLTAADVTILVLAIVLHDSALHLAEPGFEQIIRGKAKDRIIPDFDAVP